MTTLLGSSDKTMDRLRQLAGGRGWLVERAMIQDGERSTRVSLPEVAAYILDYRLEHEDELTKEHRKELREKLDEWVDHLPDKKKDRFSHSRR